jgi:hypothetical protein
MAGARECCAICCEPGEAISRDPGNGGNARFATRALWALLDKVSSSFEILPPDMSLLKQIDDKGAVLEWSPVAQHASLVALGTKVRAWRHVIRVRLFDL